MTEKYSREKHSEIVMSVLQPAIDAYRTYLATLNVPETDIDEYADKATKIHGKGLRTAYAFVQFINSLLDIDL